MPAAACATDIRTAVGKVLEPAFLRTLARLRLAAHSVGGTRPGNTPVRRGSDPTGLEVERYKAYDPGDELRFIDWNALARLDQLLVRRFRAEREAGVHVFLDGSASMDCPPADGKFPFAVALALSLAYVALHRHELVRLIWLGEHGSGESFAASPPVRLEAYLPRLTAFCAPLQPRGRTRLREGIRAYVQQTRAPGLAIVISDFLVEPDDWRAALRELGARGFHVAALRPLGDREREPALLFRRGLLVDVESGRQRAVSLTPERLAQYQAALRAHLETLEAECARGGAIFAVCDTAAGLEHCLFRQLPAVGLLR